MRKAQKQEVLEFIQSLYQAHEEIKEALNQNNRISAQNMLAECQEFATSLGESIEGLEGEGHVTVSCVEAYCETLFRVYEELSSDSYNETKIYKKLKKQLLKVENSAKNDIAVRKEVVFLPYKASMWDSLESVWKAADADEQCDAFVIPIPYYDKNPDGSFRQIHYEGNQYPEYVPITSYEDYDFKTRKPDIIYIHNPYDNMNLVTSVPPFFFSDNLKKFTDKLVYIPYFILNEIKPEEDEKIEGMKHFCTVPGVFNADRVIVQSEDMKQVYIKVLLDATNDHTQAARAYWEKKILGLGSPKIDKVVNIRKEDLDIPQEWLKVIQKPDGSWKKIVFYNTSVGALLQNSEQMLKKMEDVFQVFKECKEKVTLLWRPHPLINATISSMRPQLKIEYDHLVEKFREEGWGIYDDSSNIDRAVVLSDKYYGDMSSVVHLYTACNKPILIQSIWMLSNHKNRINTQIEAGAVIYNNIYYTIPRYNKFYCTNLENGNTKCIKNSLGKRTGDNDRFNHATILEDSICFFSDETYEYAILNVNTYNIEEGYWKIKSGETKYLGTYNNTIYLIEQNTNLLYEINRDGIVRCNELREQQLVSSDNLLWYFEKEKYMLWKIDIKENQKEKLLLSSDVFKSNNYSFVFEKDNYLVFVPDLSDGIVVYNLQNKHMKKFDLPKSTTFLLGGIGAFRYIEGTDKRCFLSSVFSSELYLWRKEGLKEIGRMGIGVETESFQEIYEDLMKDNLFGELYMDLSIYINL
ncbi:MAG: CDP-glycerol glycerophosphotransferase family protein [Lachnospiraceae bacterium]